MSQTIISDITAAFEAILQAVDKKIKLVGGIGANAFQSQDLERAKDALALSDRLARFQGKLVDCRREWGELDSRDHAENVDGEPNRDHISNEGLRRTRHDSGRLRNGERLPESAYYGPILQVLDEMGGSGKTAEVLKRVHRIVKQRLKDVDLEPTSGNPEPRWRNNAQWARNTMVDKLGWLRKGSARGVWEITEIGRRELRQMG